MAEDGKPGPTASEAIFFFNIIQHMKNKGDIDWDAVAETTGFKNASVAKVRFGQIKRKYGFDGESPTKKAGKAAQQPGDLPATPTKVTKPRKAPASGGRGRKTKKDPEEEDYNEVLRAIKEKSVTPVVKEEGGDWSNIKSETPTEEFSLF
ncbi:hypothetical protein CCM_04558 [Cordyceps militaris CM01]|uniref:Myb-like DNA-binding domain-containing protein n=1 Tax=Cordyceps militaris (strain CM01) TaxID=983644 RepID=G3JFV2_CORMM|nr:uncharacterized protein CCM_04558 [Cordyceps militaris CM01]EGX93186.1 hypothetical protein CCM_04558 [Cordyceps militaris CM01]